MIKKFLHYLRFLISRRDKTTFEYDGRMYRLTGYYYTYTTSDNQRIHARVKKLQANTVSGYGIAGCIISIADIKFTSRISKHPGEGSDAKRIQQDYRNYKFLKSLPKGMSSDEVSDKQMDNIMDELSAGRKERVWSDIEEINCTHCKRVTGHRLKGEGEFAGWACIHCGTVTGRK